NAGEGEAVADIVRGARTIGRGAERASESESGAVKERIAEERTLVVDGVGPSVCGEEKQPSFADLLGLQVKRQSVVTRKAFVAAAVHAGEAGAIDGVGNRSWARSAGWA